MEQPAVQADTVVRPFAQINLPFADILAYFRKPKIYWFERSNGCAMEEGAVRMAAFDFPSGGKVVMYQTHGSDPVLCTFGEPVPDGANLLRETLAMFKLKPTDAVLLSSAEQRRFAPIDMVHLKPKSNIVTEDCHTIGDFLTRRGPPTIYGTNYQVAGTKRQTPEKVLENV